MHRKIVFATNNSHKLDEIRQLIGDRMEILSLRDIGCFDDIPEDSDTFEGNALQKAQWIKSKYGYDCFADDSGLEVEALNGRPGVYSARYAGDGHDSEANIDKLLGELIGKSDRRAQFRTVIALILGNETHLFDGAVKGQIINERHGQGGFGYDPVFVPDGYSQSFAEMKAEEKNRISHRGQAVSKLLKFFSI